MADWTPERHAAAQAQCKAATDAWSLAVTDIDASNWGGEYSNLIHEEFPDALRKIEQLEGEVLTLKNHDCEKWVDEAENCPICSAILMRMS